ncbi:hypothetical protein HF086_012836 [Spodoptera exigua]|uniref:Uncharacterized protein n=1 Tax=Spodoptera exigua TaxID=7107 RepID=A0A922SJ16_SPOEX|nr:hypothetical protein HF086_012836 [Spodoptera exigua]
MKNIEINVSVCIPVAARGGAHEAGAMRDHSGEHPRRWRRDPPYAALPGLRGDKLHCLRARQPTHWQGDQPPPTRLLSAAAFSLYSVDPCFADPSGRVLGADPVH